jgi:hypothetical protein
MWGSLRLILIMKKVGEGPGARLVEYIIATGSYFFLAQCTEYCGFISITISLHVNIYTGV